MTYPVDVLKSEQVICKKLPWQPAWKRHREKNIPGGVGETNKADKTRNQLLPSNYAPKT